MKLILQPHIIGESGPTLPAQLPPMTFSSGKIGNGKLQPASWRLGGNLCVVHEDHALNSASIFLQGLEDLIPAAYYLPVT